MVKYASVINGNGMHIFYGTLDECVWHMHDNEPYGEIWRVKEMR